MDQYPAKVTVAALADPQKLRFAAGRHLARSEAEPGGKIPSPAKRLRPSHRGDEGGRIQRADPRDRRKELHRDILARDRNELGIEGAYPLVESAPLGPHVLDQQSDPAADRHLASKELIQSKFESAPSRSRVREGSLATD